jgi:hypothetical protein
MVQTSRVVVQRAKRFPVRLPIQYRETGSPEWHSGHTENVSFSGIFFRGRHRLQRFAPVEVILQVPQQLSGDTPVTLLCQGLIVRTTQARFPTLKIGLAAHLNDFRLASGAVMSQSASGDVLHNFTNLLAIVIGNSELILSQDNLPNELQRSALRIKKTAQQAADLVRELRVRK